MGASSSFPIDLILFGMIAAFLVLRLRSILGRRTGFERQTPPYQPPAGQNTAAPVIDAQPEPPAPAGTRTLPEPTSAIGQTLGRMHSVDRGFDPPAFLDGAEKAFRIIVTAFAAGDRATLQGLLSTIRIAALSRRSRRGRQLAKPRSAPFMPSTVPRSKMRTCVARLLRFQCGSSPIRPV
jgi:predicted lipid-binding transport protein (Tim44 family)